MTNQFSGAAGAVVIKRDSPAPQAWNIDRDPCHVMLAANNGP